MTFKHAAATRLHNQQIAASACQTPREVVAALAAMQSQDYTGALWSIGARLPGATEKDIEQAVADRQIVRTWPMRGTLHFVAAEDVRWMLAVLTPRMVAGAAKRREQLELDDRTFLRCEKVFLKALQGHRQMTREELFEALRKGGIMVDGQRGYHILWRLAQEGLLCFSSRQGKQPTFALLDEWIPTSRTLERGAALGELARRYFQSHGPATLQDFAWWSGLKAADARAGVEAAAAELAQETIEGRACWLAGSPREPRRGAPTAHLLSGFDEYLLGYQDRSAVLDPEFAGRIIPGGNGVFLPTIVVNGRVAGTWKRALKKNAVVITGTAFAKIGPAETRACVKAAERYGAFLGLAAELRWGE
jgi:Winged helix DNA-binding domain